MYFRLTSIAFVAGFCALTAPAHAQSDSPSGGVRELRGEGADYEVAFLDDPLQALDPKSSVARIHLAPGRYRLLLIRPRTSFVASMLKSVEDM